MGIKGLDDWLTRGPEEVEHDPRCPGDEDWRCDDCEKSDLCCAHAEDLDCICADLEADAKADAAQAKYDAIREREFNP